MPNFISKDIIISAEVYKGNGSDIDVITENGKYFLKQNKKTYIGDKPEDKLKDTPDYIETKVPIKEGDYIVTSENNKFVIDKEEFESNYIEIK